MCRIVGFLDKTTNSYDRRQILKEMRDALSYGGPDAAGEHFDLNDRMALGHRRLSILDLSSRADQPMCKDDLVLCFNGEAYNFRDVQKTLGSSSEYKTDSDTEVILRGFQKHGVDIVHQLRGMFSFAVWDSTKRQLLLCRDRLGVKPMYWYLHDSLFMFASELKAFHAHPRFNKEINRKAVATYLSFGYIPAPESIYHHVHKLKPGHFLTVSEDLELEETQYWSVEDAYRSERFSFNSDDEAKDSLTEQLEDSLKLRMVSDVPVGIFLSGGVDSSLVTAILQKNINHQLKTFTIGFEDAAFNEADKAAKIAEHLGTDHHSFVCTENDFASIVPTLPELADEPLGDVSIIPTFLVAKFARQEVKVSLSADGGDELFGGYTKYEFVDRWSNRLSKIPLPLRQIMQWTARNAYRFSTLRALMQMPISGRYSNVDAKLLKLIRSLGARGINEFFECASRYTSPHELQELIGQTDVIKHCDNVDVVAGKRLGYLGMLDVRHYLEGDILTKVDRATMRVALEGRDPLLDQNLVEFGLSLPDHMKIRGGMNKYLLRKVLEQYLPQHLSDSVKYGFSVPFVAWLKTEFSGQLRELASEQGFIEQFGFHRTELKNIVDSFLEGNTGRDPMLIWFIFVLYIWYRRWCV